MLASKEENCRGGLIMYICIHGRRTYCSIQSRLENERTANQNPVRLNNDDRVDATDRPRIFPEIIIYTLHFSMCYDDLGVCVCVYE